MLGRNQTRKFKNSLTWTHSDVKCFGFFFSKIHPFLIFFFIVKPSQLMRLYRRRSLAVLFDVSFW